MRCSAAPILSSVLSLSLDGANCRTFASAWLVKRLVLCGLLAILFGACSTYRAASAGPTGADSQESAVLYRRIFVPADRVEAWPLHGEKLFPVESQEFAAWVQKANRHSQLHMSGTVISEAEYIGKLENDQIVGSGRWTIVSTGDRATFLPLGPLSFAVDGARWRGTTEQAARLGMWGQNGGFASQFGLEVPRSGELIFAWHVRAKPVYGGIEIPWRTPQATIARLILDLPAGKHPQLGGAIILSSRKLQPNSDAKTSAMRRWELALNTSVGSTLKIMDVDNQSASDQPTPAVREFTSYRITSRGLDIETSWQFSEEVGRRTELVLPLAEGIQLLSASSAKRELSWRTVTESSEGDNRRIVRIVLPVNAEQQTTKITIQAWHPLVLEKLWRLPKLRPDGVFWVSGKTILEISDELELRDLTGRGCLQVGITKGKSNLRSNLRRDFAVYAPDAEMQVLVAERAAEASVRIGTSLTMAEPDISGRMVTQWESVQGNVHRLSGELAADWIIEAVETVPSDVLSDWLIDRNNGRQRLEIQLVRPIERDHKISVVITGRLQRLGIRSPLSVQTMRMIAWDSARVTRHLLMLRPAEPYTTEAIGNLPLIAADTITDEDRSLLSVTNTGEATYDLAQASPEAGLQLVPKRGAFEAHIRLEATYRRRELRQSHFIEIRPGKERVDRVLVFATTPLGDDVRWTEVQSATALVAERLPKDDPRQFGFLVSGELWLVHLVKQTSPTINIVATASVPWSSRKQVPLLVLPEATAQQGSVLLRVEEEETPSIETQGMTSLAMPDELPHGKQHSKQMVAPVYAAYRFQPSDCLMADSNVLLWLSPEKKQQTAPIIAHHVDLESCYQSDGRGTHRVTYRLEKREAATSVQMPQTSDAVVTGVWVNGQALEPSRGNVANGFLQFALPAGEPLANVLITLETTEETLAAGRKLDPPPLLEGVPILAGEWKVWLPEEFSAICSSDSSEEANNSWRTRLFGPLGRPRAQSPFNPFRIADWLTLVSPTAAGQTAQGAQQGSSSTMLLPDLAGWRSYQCRFIDEQPTTIIILHSPLISSWALAVFMGCAVLGVWVRRRRGDWFIVLLALVAAGCFLLPVAFAPLATGGFLGLLFSLLVVWPGRLKTESGSVHTFIQLPSMGAVSMLLATCVAQQIYAEAAPVAAPTDQSVSPKSIYPLFVPVDADGRPVGDKYYLGEKFFRDLLHAAQDSAPMGQWLIRDAEYVINLAEPFDTAVPVVGKWNLKYDLEVLARDTYIVLPLVRSDAEWETTVLLDGVPEPLIWQSDDRGCSIHVREPGQYSLLIACTPRATQAEGEYVAKLSIPTLMGAVVRLDSVPAGISMKINGVEVVQSDMRSSTGLQTALDGADYLELKWNANVVSAEGSHTIRAVGLRWIRVSHDKVELEAKYLIEGSAAATRRHPDKLVVTFDQEWQLDPKGSSLSDGWEVRPVDGQGMLSVPWPQGLDGRQEVTFRWRLAEAPILGRLRLPAVELVSLPVTQHWLAVSTEPTLECGVVDATASSATAKDFLSMWGETSDGNPPQLVFDDFDPRANLTLSIRPRPVESAIDEALHVAIASNKTRFVYQADVAPRGDHEYCFPLLISPELKIEQVVVTCDGESVVVETFRPNVARLNIFFHQHLEKNYRIVISGSLPGNNKEPRSLPRITAVRMRPGLQHVQLYREEDLILELSGLGGPQDPTASLLQPPFPWSARPVAAYRLDSAVVELVRVAVSPNKISIQGPSLITMTREASSWIAQFEGQFRVEQGQLSSLRFRVSPTWAGPYRVESNIPARATISEGNKQHSIVSVRFERSVGPGETVSLSIQGPLTFGTLSPVMVPEIVPEPLPHGQQYVVVPAIVDGQRVDWTSVGVRSAEPPAELLQLSPDHLSPSFAKLHRSFEIITSPFRVALRPRVVPLTGRVRLSDTRAYLGEDGSRVLFTRLIVIPYDLSTCTLQVPNGQQLISVDLDGRPAFLREQSANEWLISVGPTHFPRVLDIITRSVADAETARSIQLRQPRLLAEGRPISAEVTLWSVGHSYRNLVAHLTGVAAVASEDQVALRRLDRLVSIAEGARGLLVDEPLDGYGWFHGWATWLGALKEETTEAVERAARRRLVRQVPQSAEEPFAVAFQRIDKWKQECSDVFEKSGLPPLRESARSNELAAWPKAYPIVRRWVYCVAEDDLYQLTMEVPWAEARAGHVRVVGTVVIVAVAAAAYWLSRRPAISDLVYRFPHAITFGIGIAYWAWLRPSWLGLVIAATSILLAVHRGWPGKSLPLEGSTVVRTERSNRAK